MVWATIGLYQKVFWQKTLHHGSCDKVTKNVKQLFKTSASVNQSENRSACNKNVVKYTVAMQLCFVS